MRKRAYYTVNGITFYRLIAAPVLILLIFLDQPDIFKWLLAVSFFTDAIDGYLARRYKVTSVMGSRLDSVADDLTIVAALVGIFVFIPGFIKQEMAFIILLLILYLLQTILALIRYHKLSSFHTYTAKFAAVLQGIFLLLIFFLDKPPHVLFYIAAIFTAIDLIEEIILILLLPKWKNDVRGVYWEMKKKQQGR
ncbi:CDP-diacylglycerol--glycerol-3-phosphate 3-phosphatidyltransferase [Chitinophaga sp. CF118]|uniref:CDP-alcohol phosphatidyltransferase family protein n=1 Tax=Chitinophaga sp. CF118 TaxID=1884367 RepID=UPI0008F3D5CF|nr:CDP-alcohol phosphatidyltransferase family protein [Chitinophaga sp. CF118]SFE91295.1 CDP-diacylglycerol--glycerol-3-phosphate 3-phosphatidyltransferase [Chitinophaga sp. CF118]